MTARDLRRAKMGCAAMAMGALLNNMLVLVMNARGLS